MKNFRRKRIYKIAYQYIFTNSSGQGLGVGELNWATKGFRINDRACNAIRKFVSNKYCVGNPDNVIILNILQMSGPK